MVIIILSLFLLFAILERVFPLRTNTQSIVKRWPQNLIFGLVLFFTAMYTVAPTIDFMMRWTSVHHFGLLILLPLPDGLQLVFGCLLLDLTFYYWHRANHEWPLLWRFHRVHHIDPDMDVTTSIRFHAIEIAYSSLFRILQIGLIGVQPITFVVYEFLFQVNTYFQHSNIRLPVRFEQVMNLLFITPRIHGIHHSQVRSERDQNYGSVFSFWDRLHGTWLVSIPQEKIKIGVEQFTDPKDNTVRKLFMLPFTKKAL